jgi:hypothetical protein
MFAPAPEVAFTLKTGTDETNGAWTLFEYTVPPRFAGPPPHWHKTTDEGFLAARSLLRNERRAGDETTSRASDGVLLDEEAAADERRAGRRSVDEGPQRIVVVRSEEIETVGRVEIVVLSVAGCVRRPGRDHARSRSPVVRRRARLEG